MALPVPALLAAVERVAQGRPLDVEPEQAAVEAAPSPADEIATEYALFGESSGTESALETEREPVFEPAPLAEAEGEFTADQDYGIASFEQDANVGDEISLNEPAVEALAEFEIVDVAETVDAVPELDVGAIVEYAIAPEEAAVIKDSFQYPLEGYADPLRAEAPAESYALKDSDPLRAKARVESYAPDEICIGSVCQSSSLYEIFVVEAHQRLAVLQEESERHAEVVNCTVSEHARRAIHTLGGIAGTAGIKNLADLSHAFEQYWNRFVHAPLPPAHLPLVEDTVARLYEMITTIEAGQLPESASDLIATLGELEDEQTAPAAEDVFELEGAPAEVIEVADEAVEPTAQSDEGMPVEAVRADVPAAPGPAHAEHAALDVSAFVSEIKSVMPVPVFERREVADEIDEQLLPIFIEEAETLVPDTSAQLRAWKVAPGDVPARDALQRNLHTIKGSARMVGAMRLGELTHVMESRVIAVIGGHLAASPDVFDTLEAQLDRVADTVERLKRGRPHAGGRRSVSAGGVAR